MKVKLANALDFHIMCTCTALVMNCFCFHYLSYNFLALLFDDSFSEASTDITLRYVTSSLAYEFAFVTNFSVSVSVYIVTKLTSNGHSVAAWTSSTLTPSATSIRVSPFLVSTSNTA